ncbi:hypothetical protein HED60_19225 [Planctomycetales bacterium ZRK34]|nr:hypothetical protein HED60_19225 [Planctomycetales bacterium ZRK34]
MNKAEKRAAELQQQAKATAQTPAAKQPPTPPTPGTRARSIQRRIKRDG